MKTSIAILSVALCVNTPFGIGITDIGQTQAAGNRGVRVFVQGDSSRLADFVESCKHEFAEHGLEFVLVKSDSDFDYNIVIAQESSVSGAAGAAVALDHRGMFVASVVRSGRWSGKGALNASAKELAKKLVALQANP